MTPQTYNPDVLSCLANLSSDEVFTPPDIASQMLDMLPQDLWRNPDARFLDPACKSGVFLREMAKRLLVGLQDQIPDLQQRIDHIMGRQLYGIGLTELTALLTRRTLYCAKQANGHYSVTQAFGSAEGNIYYQPLAHTWENGKCKHCGASQDVYDRASEAETYAYNFLHTDEPQNLFGPMKFDVIIGNPPYQMSDGGFGKSAAPLYHRFVEQAKKLEPRYLVMIIPSRWFAGGKGLDGFRKEMLNDAQIRKIVDFENANECFPGVDIAGGICYFLWEKDYNGPCDVVNVLNGVQTHAQRALNEYTTFIRNSNSIPIIRKVYAFDEQKMSSIVSSRKPFGLATNDRPKEKGDLKLKYYGGYGNYPSILISVGNDLIPLWKVITSKTSYDHAGQPDKEGKRRVFSTLEILKPNEICTETYIIVGSYNSENECINLLGYLKTKFARFLVSQLLVSQDITKERFSLVPIQDFTEPWTDEKLYAKYGLTTEEIAFIESTIRPMDAAPAGAAEE